MGRNDYFMCVKEQLEREREREGQFDCLINSLLLIFFHSHVWTNGVMQCVAFMYSV